MDPIVRMEPMIFAAAKKVGAKKLVQEYNQKYGTSIQQNTMQRYLGGGQGYEKGPPSQVKQFLIARFVRW